jgi:signal transduction histidine kinase
MLPAGITLALTALTALVTERAAAFLDAMLAFKVAVEAGAYLWAVRRTDLPVAFRRMLRLFGVVSALSVLVTGVQHAAAAGLLTHADGFIMAYGSVTYAACFGALLFYPRRSLRRPQWATLVLDLLLVGAPLAVLQWAILRETSSVVTDRVAWINIVLYGPTQVAMLCGLSMVVSVGRPIPSRRAFWWLMGGLASYVPTAVFGQVGAIAGSSPAQRLSAFFYFGGTVALLVAAVRIRRDPFAPPGTLSSPDGLGGINPLSLAMPMVVGTALALVVSRGLDRLVIPLFVTLVGSTILLMLHVLLSRFENARLRREQQLVEERLRTQREQARLEERERILLELHDGVGSQLTLVELMLRDGTADVAEAADVVQACLGDMRLFVDTLNNTDGSLEGAFADLRHRLRQRLGPSGPAFAWHLSLEGLPPLSDEALMQSMRIVQEALTNVLRHARAQSVQVNATFEHGTLVLEVRDDGVGLTKGTGGRGLRNMQHRAARLGGSLTVGAAEGGRGTTMRAVLPVAPLVDVAA